MQCLRCGLIYLSPRPGPHEIAAYYPPEYGAYRGAIEDEHSPLMRLMRRRKLTLRRSLVERYSGLPTGRILDVGCATGLFLHEMAEAGWQATGVELSAAAAAYARNRFGLRVIEGMLAQTEFAAASFDVATYWDVLEHTYSPLAELQQVSALLRPGGLLAINVPNWASPDRRLFGPHWIGYDPPRHLYVFTRSALTQLLTTTGFQPLAWVCFMPSYFTTLASLERWLRARAPRRGHIVRRVLNLPGMRLVFEPIFGPLNWSGRGGTITVFARKR